jgi:hypothetical protein
MEAGKFQLIQESDYVLSRCGRFVPPVGSVVYIAKSFLLQAVLPVAANQTFYKEITGDTMWCWRALSIALSGNPPQVFAQVLKPDGQFLFDGLMDLTQVAGFGSVRYLLSREIEVPPGSKIQLTLDDNYLAAAAVQPVSFLAEGAYAYVLKDGIRSRSVEQEVSGLPRIFAGPNQNILAPCWAMGAGVKTPQGFVDRSFTYGDGHSNVATLTLGTNASRKASIQIDSDSDFQLRRFLFDITYTGAVSPPFNTFLVRIRTGSGYSFTDDYVDVRKFGSAYFAKGWDIKKSDQILFDFLSVDESGAGTATIQVFADGVKRRAA